MRKNSPHTQIRNPSQRKRKAKKLVRSKYFSRDVKFPFRFRAGRNRTPTALSPNAAKEAVSGGATSDYFLRSPCSTHGSVLSLGPLLYTWINNTTYEDIRSNCTGQISTRGRMRNPCNACTKVLTEDAFRHFEPCPVFRKNLEAYSRSTACSSASFLEQNHLSTCVEKVGRWIEEHGLRHLCPNQCYMRAFAPRREWLTLRKEMIKLLPIGEILNDWTCRLVYEEIPDRERGVRKNLKDDENSVPLLPAQLHRTEFVSIECEKPFPSFQKVRKSILSGQEPVVCSESVISSQSKYFAIDATLPRTLVKSLASPLGLVEELFPNDPWRVLISTMLLNKTQRKQNVDGILFYLFQKWPNAVSVVNDADVDEDTVRRFVFSLVRPAGLGRSKAKTFVRLSRDYVSLIATKSQEMQSSDPGATCSKYGIEFSLARNEVKQLFGCGDYAADAYQLFVRRDFESPLLSDDMMLLAYVEWKRSVNCIPERKVLF